MSTDKFVITEEVDSDNDKDYQNSSIEKPTIALLSFAKLNWNTKNPTPPPYKSNYKIGSPQISAYNEKIVPVSKVND